MFLCEYVYRLLYVGELFVGDFCLCKRVATCDPHTVVPFGRVCASGPCQWMCAHKCVFCLSACIALLCVYVIYMRNMAPRWRVSSEVRLLLYG